MALPLRIARTLIFPGTEPVPDLPAGVLVELSGDRQTARLSSAVSALRAAQARGETTAWVQRADGPLYPPDLADAGVDLDALVVVRVPGPETLSPENDAPGTPPVRIQPGRTQFLRAQLRRNGTGLPGIIRATEMLVRSGAFGFVVVDLREDGRLPPAWQGRLLSAAREHGSRIVFLSSHAIDRESVGALVGLRLEPHRVRFAPGLFAIEHRVLKNKPGLPFADASEHRRGPWGLR